MSVIHIASAFDDAYAPHFATLVRSIEKVHAAGEVKFTVICDDSLTCKTRERLSQYFKSLRIEFKFKEVEREKISLLPQSSRYPAPMWFRLLLPDLLDEARIIYLDPDTLVLQNLQPLFNDDIYPFLLAAVAAPAIGGHQHMKSLGANPTDDYFYSGMILMDLERLRQENFTACAIEVAAEKMDLLQFPDQDVLNLVLAKKWKKLPPRWHATSYLWQDRRFIAGNVYPSIDYQMATLSPAIVHFEGPKSTKPWHSRSSHPMRNLYRHFRSETPWRQYKLEGGTVLSLVLGKLPLLWQYRLSRFKNKLLSAIAPGLGR